MKAVRRSLAMLVAAFALLLLVYFVASRDDTQVPAPPPISADVPLAGAPAPSPTELSVGELCSVLAEVCSTSDAGSANKDEEQEDIQARIDAFKELRLNLSDSLSASASAEHLHLAALLSNDPVAQIKLIEQAISRSPSDPFLLWSAVRICSDPAVSLDCPLGDWEQRLIMVDGQNRESWIRIAANRLAAGEADAALEALRHAATAAETRIYWTETVEMTERGLVAAGGDYPFSERAETAFGIAAMMLPVYSDYTRMCAKQAPLSADWAYACLGYGKLAENQGKIGIDVATGRQIQKTAYEALGELEKAADVANRLQRHRQERLSADFAHTQLIDRLLVSNPTMFWAYLAAIRSVGEEAARRKITADIERIIAQQPDLACAK